ncbi:hypothetical protein FHW88_006082 [Mucilaginibacter sp. SG538B]|nr:hypothetical protein [Mucilaginibacter sp. SG538B]
MKPIQTNHDYSKFALAVTNEQALPAELFREMVTPRQKKCPAGPAVEWPFLPTGTTASP